MRRIFSGGVTPGVVAGIIWGWVCMLVNAFTGVFPFEGSFAHNAVTFASAGAVFGLVIYGLLTIAGSRLPFRNSFAKAVFISTALWLALRGAGMMLSAMEPGRYHLLNPEFIQGVLLSVLLGAIMGLIMKLKGSVPLHSSARSRG